LRVIFELLSPYGGEKKSLPAPATEFEGTGAGLSTMNGGIQYIELDGPRGRRVAADDPICFVGARAPTREGGARREPSDLLVSRCSMLSDATLKRAGIGPSKRLSVPRKFGSKRLETNGPYAYEATRNIEALLTLPSAFFAGQEFECSN